jgi:uncharacterized protein (DUF1697 family)
MTAHVFLFRAINVGGTAKLPMAELRELATELGATGVSTYIASGNLFATRAARVGHSFEVVNPVFTLDRLLRTLGVTGTARNLHTVDELMARLGG